MNSRSDENNPLSFKNLPWIAVFVGPVILFGPMLLRGEVLFWGTPLLQFTPWRTLALATLREGHLPLWNPLLGMGAPLLANYQTAFLYPPNWLLLFFDVAWGQTLLVMLHLIWAGLGMTLLARRLGMSNLAQAVAGVAFGLSGYLVARAGFLSINAAAAWLPWEVAAVDRLAESVAHRDDPLRARAWSVALFALTLGLQWLSGHAQIAWYSLVFVAVWGLWRGFSFGGVKGTRRMLVSIFISSGLAFGFAAVQLLPTLEYLVNSQRASSLEPDFVMTYSFWPWRLLGLLAPDLFGSPATGDYWGYANYWEDAIYIGVLPFLLVVGGLVEKRDRPQKLRWMLVGVAVVSFLFALGKNTPVFPFLFHHVPTFNLFQAPTRWNLLLVFSLALLAGFGLDRWRAAEGRRLYWTRLGTAGSAVVGIAAWIASRSLPEVEATFIPAITAAGLWLSSAGVLALTRKEPPGRIWAGSVIGVVVADLTLAGFGLNPSVSRALHHGSSALVEQIDTDHRLYVDSVVEYELKFERSFRFDTFHPGIDWRWVRDVGIPNTTILDDLPSANNFDPILPASYLDWMGVLSNAPPASQIKLLELMDVGWVATLYPDAETGVRWERVPSPARVRLVPESVWVETSDKALERITDPAFDPSQTVILDSQLDLRIFERGGTGIVEVMDPSPNLIIATVEAPAGGWLVLSDLWYPGWRAKLDDEPTEMFRADGVFRAVWVPPGEHQVGFVFRPPSFMVGTGLSLVTLVSIVLISLRWRA